MRTLSPILAVLLWLGLAAPSALAHPGGLDANGCHYEVSAGDKHGYHCHRDVSPNPDRSAPVKKSRENICHDRSSPNYKTLLYFIPYRDMDSCLKSGGRKPR